MLTFFFVVGKKTHWWPPHCANVCSGVETLMNLNGPELPPSINISSVLVPVWLIFNFIFFKQSLCHTASLCWTRLRDCSLAGIFFGEQNASALSEKLFSFCFYLVTKVHSHLCQGHRL